jgi:hypothetical protein
MCAIAAARPPSSSSAAARFRSGRRASAVRDQHQLDQLHRDSGEGVRDGLAVHDEQAHHDARLMFVAVWIVPLLRRLDLMSVFNLPGECAFTRRSA